MQDKLLTEVCQGGGDDLLCHMMDARLFMLCACVMWHQARNRTVVSSTTHAGMEALTAAAVRQACLQLCTLHNRE